MARKLTSKVDAAVARVDKQATSKTYSEKSVFPKEGKEKLTVNLDTDTSIQLATLAKKCRMSRGQLIDELVRGFGDKIKPQKPAHLRDSPMTVGEAIEWLEGFEDIVVDWINAVAVWFFDEGLFNLVSGNFLDLTLGQVAFTLFMIWAAYVNIRQLIRDFRGT